MAKVNLLTIHWGCSYGAVMQTYATAKILMDCGHVVSVINVAPQSYINNRFSNIFDYVLLNHVVDYQFDKFKKKNFPGLTRFCTSLNESDLPEAEYTVVGSDQVWNPDITGDLSDHFFLDYVTAGKKVSLASSFGKIVRDISFGNKAVDYLKDFSALSVREKSGCDFLRSRGLKCEQLIDPTLAYGTFSHFVQSNKKHEEIFPFLFGPQDRYISILSYLSQKTGIPIHKYSKLGLRISQNPENWLDRIKNSRIIVTNSFHGLAFSLLFQKHVIVLNADSAKFTRIESLLDLLSLKKQYVLSLEDMVARYDIVMQDIDYSKITPILYEQRNRYYNFIRNNII